MNSWKARIMMLVAVAAMLLTVAGPVMADDFDDCEFVGFDGFDEAVFVCDVDFDDDDFFFIDDGFDDGFFFDGFFFDDDVDEDECIGVETDDDCIGVS